MGGSGKLIHNYIYNLGFQVFTLITPLITIPYISRTLGPTNIGIYSYTLSISVYFIMVGNLGFPLYGQREIAYCRGNGQDQSKTFFEILYGQILSSLLALAIYLVYVLCFVDKNQMIYLAQGIGVLAGVLNIGWFYQGMEEFRITVRRGFTIKIVTVILLFLLVKKQADLLKYTLIINVTNLIGNLLIFYKINTYINLKEFQIPIRQIVLRLKPAFVLGIPFYVTSLYAVIDKMMIGMITGDMAQVGFYEQSQKVITFSMAIVTALGTVFMPRFATNIAEEDIDGLKRNLRNGLYVICFLAFPICVGLIALGGKIVPWFFGIGYESVALLIKVFAPIVVFLGISNFAGNQYLVAANREFKLTISIGVSVIVNFVINLLLIPIYGALGAAIATLTSEFMKLIIQVYMTRNVVQWIDVIMYSIKICVLSTIMGAFIYIINKGFMLPNTFLCSVVLIFLGIGVYALLVCFTHDRIMTFGIRLVKAKVRRLS